MELILAYTVFALATALTCLYDIFYPVVKQVTEEDPNNLVAGSKTIALTTLTLGAVLFAPVMFVAAVVPAANQRFRNSLLKSLKEQNS